MTKINRTIVFQCRLTALVRSSLLDWGPMPGTSYTLVYLRRA